MKYIFYLSTIFIALALGACSKSDQQENQEDFVSIYGGKPYKGTAKGERSANGTTNYRWEGEGRVALIEQTADSVSLVFMADFDEEGEINFKVRGRYDGQHFYTADQDDPSIYFEVSEERITSNITNDVQKMQFGGRLGREKADLTMRVEFLEASGIFPAGSELELRFETARDLATDDGDGSGCSMRLVPIWSPSGVTMGMVPDC